MRGTRTTLTATAAVLTAALGVAVGVGPATAADSPTVLGAVTLVDRGPSMVSGYTVLELSVHLTDADGLPDTLENAAPDPPPVATATVDPTGVVSTTHVDALQPYVFWDELHRVSGTATDGTWVGTTTASAVTAGTVTVTELALTDEDSGDVVSIPVTDGPDVRLVPPTGQPWTYQVLNPPVKVVSGDEVWQPSLRLVTRAGVPVAGARTVTTPPTGMDGYPVWAWSTYLPPGSGELARYTLSTSAAGTLTMPSTRVTDPQLDWAVEHMVSSVAGWGRGTSRYHTVVALGLVMPPVKWQANARFALRDGMVVATGNAWPAPSIYDAANSRVYLQRLKGRTWGTVGTAEVRANGRFTITWTHAVPAGGTWVRAYKPGGTEGHRTSVGWTGPAVLMTP